ncbi:MAG TPA: TrkA C-terminal domain-containing protein [Woeseiaceae bacterium]|nr:TrkA C-terminal domain-containing protein [Woeseiaceae bacterium]
MLGAVSLVLVVTLSILITRVAAIALIHTGVTRELARFQARSAFTGAGFTTEESERMVNHPVRRRIIMWLMFLGNAGIVTGITSLMLTFVDQGDGIPNWVKLAGLIAALGVLWLLASSDWVDRRLSGLVNRLLGRYTELNVRDYASMMNLMGDYALVDLRVREEDWLNGKTLGECNLRAEGLLVLAIYRRDDTFIGTPQPDTRFHGGDRVVLYGRVDAIDRLDERRNGVSGEASHDAGVAEQDEVVEEEKREDPAS